LFNHKSLPCLELTMDDPAKKEFIQQLFDTVSEGYDRSPLNFFQYSADHLNDYLKIKPEEHVLDVATGTGRAALTLAQQFPHARFTGVDMSSGMLNQAKDKAAKLQLNNVVFCVQDIEQLNFPDNHFDHANCSFCLFFIDDMPGVLNQVAKKVKSGGAILSTCFDENAFQPLVSKFYDRIQLYGVELPEVGFKRLADESKSTNLYRNVGLENIKTYRKNISYNLPDANAWWEIIWYAGFRGLVSQLNERDQSVFREEHLFEIQQLASEQGIPLEIEVIYTVGTK